MVKLNFGGVEENVVICEEFLLEKVWEIMKDEIIVVIGYGVQGLGQVFNFKDNGFNVIVGQCQNFKIWDKVVDDGWELGVMLFLIEEVVECGIVIQYLLSDVVQIFVWLKIKLFLIKGKVLYFFYGFGIIYKECMGIILLEDVDVILVVFKGFGISFCCLFVVGKGLNFSYVIFQDVIGWVKDWVIVLGIGVGLGYLFEMIFKQEVYSDLIGECGFLMGVIQGLFVVQYDCLCCYGYSLFEVFNEIVEELIQSLMLFVVENGMDWMYVNCFIMVQWGVLDWWKKFCDVVVLVFDELYDSVVKGEEVQWFIDFNSQFDYWEKLDVEFKELYDSEMWRVGCMVWGFWLENQGEKVGQFCSGEFGSGEFGSGLVGSGQFFSGQWVVLQLVVGSFVVGSGEFCSGEFCSGGICLICFKMGQDGEEI